MCWLSKQLFFLKAFILSGGSIKVYVHNTTRARARVHDKKIVNVSDEAIKSHEIFISIEGRTQNVSTEKVLQRSLEITSREVSKHIDLVGSH